MDCRPLGHTGMRVSLLALGTVSLGTDYGIRTPDDSGQPTESDAIAVIDQALAAGINLFDTAPSYGDAERLLGRALATQNHCYVATKVNVPPIDTADRGHTLLQTLVTSIERSRFALQRDMLDIVQLHNPSVSTFSEVVMGETMYEMRQAGLVRFWGASVYSEEEALAAIASGWIDVLQVAFNLLDQRMAGRVFAAATKAGVGVLTRSALLKGALTEKAAWLPPELDGLRQAVEKVRIALDVSWQELPQAALRFCIGEPRVASVLIGPRTSVELEQALTAYAAGVLPATKQAVMPALVQTDAALIDPRLWPVP